MKHLIALLLTALVGSFALGGCDKDEPAPAGPPPAPEDVDGRALFMRKCARCHGEHGAGDGPGAASYARVANLTNSSLQKRLSDKRIGSIIRNGMATMPPVYGLHDIEVDAIVAYVRSLKQ